MADFKAKDFPVVQEARRAAQAQFAHYYEAMGKKAGLRMVDGDLLCMAEDGEFDVIVHGANCFCIMGSGIARQIRERYPEAYKADCKTISGDYNKLGNYTSVPTTNGFTIINAYTQYDFNRHDKTNDAFEYTSFKLILQKLAYAFPTSRIGFPMIGMGLAGGDKTNILIMLTEFAEKMDNTGGTVTVVQYAP